MRDLCRRIDGKEILVVAPYRAQRILIRGKLRLAGLRGVLVSTVHRAQGTERDTIIFDPVAAADPFLNNDNLGPRLINVAISRAKARLFLVISEKNLENKYIREIARRSENYEIANAQRVVSPVIDIVPIQALTSRRDYPRCVVGKTVRIRSTLTVRVTQYDPALNGLVGKNIANGEAVWLRVEALGKVAHDGKHQQNSGKPRPKAPISDIKDEIARLRAENEALKAERNVLRRVPARTERSGIEKSHTKAAAESGENKVAAQASTSTMTPEIQPDLRRSREFSRLCSPEMTQAF